MKKESMRGFQKYLNNLALFHANVAPKARLFSSRSDLGYTDGHTIYVNATPEQVDEAFAPAEVFSLGVFAHELLHILYTNFDYAAKKRTLLDKAVENNVFSLLSNLIEDSAIENFSSTVLGGALLKALKYSIKTVFDGSAPVNEAKSAFGQYISALIDVGDMGYYKGEFTFPEAEDMFNATLPMFYAATVEHSNAKRIDYAMELMEKTRPLWETDDVPETNDDLERGSGKGKNFSEDTKGSSPMDKTGASKNPKDAKEKPESQSAKSAKSAKGDDKNDDDDGQAASSSKGGDGDESGNPKNKPSAADDDAEASDDDDDAADKDAADNDGDEDDGDEDDGDENEDGDEEEISPEELAELMKELENEIKAAESELKEEEAYDFKPQPDGFGSVIGVSPASGASETLAEIKAKYAPSIRALKKGLASIFEQDKESFEAATSGSLNIPKYIKSTTETPTAKVFDKRRTADGKQDVSVLLLVDESGSMNCAYKMQKAQESAIMLADALVSLKIPLSVVGFSADVNRRYTADHYIYLDFGDKNIRGMTEMRARCNNRDGDSIAFAAAKLAQRGEQNRVLFVISDGQPAADSYYGTTAIEHTRQAVKNARAKGLTVFSIGVGDSSAWECIYGSGNFVKIPDASRLPGLLLKQIKKIIDKN